MSQFENRAREASGEHKENPFAHSANRARKRDHADATRSGSYGAASSAYSIGGSSATAGQAAAVMNHYADDASERGYPKVIEIGSEKISVNSSQDERLAGEIIAEVKDQYGIEVSSPPGIEAIRKEYGEVPQEVTSKLQTKHWEIKELIALRNALARFAPLLGKNRAKSSRKDAVQEVLSVSKIDQGIDHNRPDGNLDHSTAGEYFGKSKNFGLFSAGTNVVSDFSSDKKHNDKDLEGLIIHEVAHGLLVSWRHRKATLPRSVVRSRNEAPDEHPRQAGQAS